VENVGVAIEILRDVVITRLNENLVRWEFERNFLIIRLESNRGKNFRTRDENGSQEIIKPRASIRDIIRVLFRHGVRPVWDFLQ
jgi:hypothetical protein